MSRRAVLLDRSGELPRLSWLEIRTVDFAVFANGVLRPRRFGVYARNNRDYFRINDSTDRRRLPGLPQRSHAPVSPPSALWGLQRTKCPSSLQEYLCAWALHFKYHYLDVGFALLADTCRETSCTSESACYQHRGSTPSHLRRSCLRCLLTRKVFL